jgi:hypothetical protein
MGIPTRFISVIILFDRTFEYDHGGVFNLLKWMQNLHQSAWDHKLLYSDRSSGDE